MKCSCADPVHGSTWVDGPRASVIHGALEGFGWHLIRDTAEEVAAETGVSIEAVNGAVSVLFVEGVWGAVAAPGFAWCSLAAARDPKVCSEIVRATFKSSLMLAE